MAHHLTPDELAAQVGMTSEEVLERCRQWGVPVFHGRIDKTLFEGSRRAEELSAPASAGEGPGS